jgi:hypothetical protein
VHQRNHAQHNWLRFQETLAPNKTRLVRLEPKTYAETELSMLEKLVPLAQKTQTVLLANYAVLASALNQNAILTLIAMTRTARLLTNALIQEHATKFAFTSNSFWRMFTLFIKHNPNRMI